MMRTGSVMALLTATTVAMSGLSISSSSAEAGWRTGYRYAPAYRHGPRYAYGPRHYRRGYGPALGVAAGVLAVGALAAAASGPAYAAPVYAQPAYSGYGYQPSYGYAQPAYYAPVCRIRHRTVWDPYYGYVSQPVRVCR